MKVELVKNYRPKPIPNLSDLPVNTLFEFIGGPYAGEIGFTHFTKINVVGASLINGNAWWQDKSGQTHHNVNVLQPGEAIQVKE